MQFDFGENWQQFIDHGLTREGIAASDRHFQGLLDGIPLAGRPFLDIGFGQGLNLLSARKAGAVVSGVDVNPKCGAALQVLFARHASEDSQPLPSLVIGSILDAAVVDQLSRLAPSGRFDVVHSWGVLHHTGDLRLAMRHAASLVGPDGHLILAIYNRHWSGPLWKPIKRFYCLSPNWVRKGMIGLFYPVIGVAKWLVTGRNPFQQQRGMDFRTDVIDWVGGHPYEYASMAEVCQWVGELGFAVVRAIPAQVPTGCNEFVLRRIPR